jgi:uncharacterized protein YdbL (DUF1318 family)
MAATEEVPSMRRFIAPAFALTALTLAACVTINVYFPAAAAEKAADRIIEDVWGPEGKPKGDDQSSLLPGRDAGEVLLAGLSRTLDLVIPAAQAKADLDVSSPAIRRLVASMEARHAQLEPYYASGALGLTADGLVELRDPNAVPLAERNAARKLVADENADRNSLYREIAAANGKPEWESDIRSTFAQRWVAKARSGWWYRDAAGGWTQK